MHFETALEWYRQIISLYDKQSWELTVEQRILQGLSYEPRKNAKLKTDLIDVDLVRGSTFPKAKPQSDIWLACLHGIIRMLFLPFCYKWWIRETSHMAYCLIFSVYCSLIASCGIYVYFSHTSLIKIIPLSEVVLPLALLLLLSLIHSQITCTRRRNATPLALAARLKNSSLRKPKNEDFLKINRSYRDSVKAVRNRNFSRKEVWFCNRSHSEDSKRVNSMGLVSKSASDSNLSSLKCPCKYQTTSFFSSKSSNEFLDPSLKSKTRKIYGELTGEKTSSSTECILRYRGYKKASDSEEYFEGKKLPSYRGSNFLKLTGRHNSRKSPSPRHTRNSRDLERSSEGATDGFHADCESPASEEESSRSGQEQSRPRKKSFTLPKKRFGGCSQFKVPFAVINSNGSNSSCESEGELHGIDSLPAFWKQKCGLNKLFGPLSNKEPSCSSESEGPFDDFAESDHCYLQDETLDWHIQGSPAAVIHSQVQVPDKVSCKIWEGSEVKKVYLSVLDIASLVIKSADAKMHKSQYLSFGIMMSGIIALVPSFYRFLIHTEEDSETPSGISIDTFLGNDFWCVVVILLSAVNRFVLGSCFFFLLSVAERIFQQRFLYAKHFCYLTSARRARKYDLLHFRLNKVINIKSWLSIRSCLKKRGPQHSIDVIVSATFCITIILVCYLCFGIFKEEEQIVHPLLNCELFVWCFTVSIYLIRFMTLGVQINQKYSSPSILITEQINMYFHMEQKPEKKEDLMLANNVLGLVSGLLKELESPFKISGLSANPLLYDITKFVILSACSAVLSDLLGFKIKLHRIKF